MAPAIRAEGIAGSVGAGGFPTEHGYVLAFGMCAVALAVAVLAGFAIPRRDQGARAPVVAEGAAG